MTFGKNEVVRRRIGSLVVVACSGTVSYTCSKFLRPSMELRKPIREAFLCGQFFQPLDARRPSVVGKSPLFLYIAVQREAASRACAN